MSWRKSKFFYSLPLTTTRLAQCSHSLAETKADPTALSDSSLHSAAPTPPPTTPEPQELPDDEPISGRLTIQISAARGLSLPQDALLPDAVQKMIDSQAATLAASVTPSTVNHQRARLGHKSRDSVQRQQSWWLPYCILEFDLNEVWFGTRYHHDHHDHHDHLLTLPCRFSSIHSEEASLNQSGCTRQVCTSLPTYPVSRIRTRIRIHALQPTSTSARIHIRFAALPVAGVGVPLSLPRLS